ncbi:hypothetical protein AB0E12_17260 [Micromonospora chersina]|uniref:hypothetical protein n=1 Tax=Micromonospora chersina TaxID=47854 RepID=UPI0033ED4F75
MLPAEGRAGDPPAWPLVAPSSRELDVWRSLWSRPQAVAWQRLGLDVEAALYVRYLTQAELPGAPAALGTLVRQYCDSLGLSVAGLRANRWRIAREETRPTTSTARPSSRTRLALVADPEESE